MPPGNVTLIDRSDPAYAGQALYSSAFLRIYDQLIYGFNCPVIWRCPRAPMVELYDDNVSSRHLDVGVGTGLLLDLCRFPAERPEITLFDANPNSLKAASRRIRRYAPATVEADVLKPWPLEDRFETIALVHLLHCLPGDSIADKEVVIESARERLAPGGSLFGATILGDPELQSGLSRRVLPLANRRGALSNLGDRRADLDAALGRHFDSHQLKVRGAVALFVAPAPA
jgi:SAM-dependent methyltransferase